MEINKANYFYSVEESVTTFEKDPDKTKPLYHTAKFDPDFYDKNFIKAKLAAVKYYDERVQGMEKSSFFLPWASPEEFKLGENAAYSITLYLVVQENIDSEIVEYSLPVLGEDIEEMEEGLDLESHLFHVTKSGSN